MTYGSSEMAMITGARRTKTSCVSAHSSRRLESILSTIPGLNLTTFGLSTGLRQTSKQSSMNKVWTRSTRERRVLRSERAIATANANSIADNCCITSPRNHHLLVGDKCNFGNHKFVNRAEVDGVNVDGAQDVCSSLRRLIAQRIKRHFPSRALGKLFRLASDFSGKSRSTGQSFEVIGCDTLTADEVTQVYAVLRAAAAVRNAEVLSHFRRSPQVLAFSGTVEGARLPVASGGRRSIPALLARQAADPVFGKGRLGRHDARLTHLAMVSLQAAHRRIFRVRATGQLQPPARLLHSNQNDQRSHGALLGLFGPRLSRRSERPARGQQ